MSLIVPDSVTADAFAFVWKTHAPCSSLSLLGEVHHCHKWWLQQQRQPHMADTEWTMMQTAMGMVINILTDNLVEHNDAADLGGNSVGQAWHPQSSPAAAWSLPRAHITWLTPAVNMATNATLLNGSLTSINLGNTGVGTFQTKVVDVLLSPYIWFHSAHITATVLAQHSVGPPVGKSAEYPMISRIHYATCSLHPGVLSMIGLHWSVVHGVLQQQDVW
ncbi:hypothetical protein B0H10DRAFT_1963753 [Mycena sp. CBHHK59/15]|nr:hypothetical protein B0H10DRAFT_1963753 [Mycena sp. CBHHK59/15]